MQSVISVIEASLGLWIRSWETHSRESIHSLTYEFCGSGYTNVRMVYEDGPCSEINVWCGHLFCTLPKTLKYKHLWCPYEARHSILFFFWQLDTCGQVWPIISQVFCFFRPWPAVRIGGSVVPRAEGILYCWSVWGGAVMGGGDKSRSGSENCDRWGHRVLKSWPIYLSLPYRWWIIMAVPVCRLMFLSHGPLLHNQLK